MESQDYLPALPPSSVDAERSVLGAVLQDTHLFTGTVMENIRYGRLDAPDEEVIAILPLEDVKD